MLPGILVTTVSRNCGIYECNEQTKDKCWSSDLEVEGVLTTPDVL
jgi:hypothetical protein